MINSNKTAIYNRDRRLIEIEFKFNKETLELVRSIPGRQFHNGIKRKYWTCPPSLEALDILIHGEFTLDKALQARYVRLSNSPSTIPQIEVKGLKRELFPFQKEGVSFLEHKDGRAIIGDEMGLGKTVQALAYLQHHPELRPAIILCPAHLKLNWEKEIKNTMTGACTVQVLSGGTPYPLTADIIIINYDILTQWLDTLISFKPQILIIDEIHYCKNSKTKRTESTQKLSIKCNRVIGLTGTLLVNRPVEAFIPVTMVDNTILPNYWSYVHKYCGAKRTRFGWDFQGATNKQELHQILKKVMIRRKKTDVLKDLPNKIYSYIPMELSNLKEYHNAEGNFLSYLLETKGEESVESAKRALHLVKIEHLKQLAVEGKWKQALQWIKTFLEDSDEKLVVFTVHKAAIDNIMNEFPGMSVRVDGGVSIEDREKAVEQFQTNPNIRLFVGNIQAAGTGLTLTNASNVAFLELPWIIGDLMQAEDRCHRIGQKNTVFVHYLLAADTVEMDIAELLDKKRDVVDQVIDGKDVEEIPLITELVKLLEKK